MSKGDNSDEKAKQDEHVLAQEPLKRCPEEIGLELVCAVTQSMFKSRRLVREATFDNCLKSGKRWLRRTLESAAVRQAIGSSAQQWLDMSAVFHLALPVLEIQSIPLDSPGTVMTSAAIIALNHDTLMKDLERLNDILLIGRNCLATTPKAQNLAGESLLDQQVLKLIDLCVRVTARGYDGESPSRAEQPWANVISAYKKLLITCLQFLHNFIMKNEQRKLLLWLDLFANSKAANGDGVTPDLIRERLEAQQVVEALVQDAGTLQVTAKAEDPEESPLQTSSENDVHRQDDTKLDASSDHGKPDVAVDLTADAEDVSTSHPESQDAKLDALLEDDEGLGTLRTPQSAAITLQTAKDQLMARLADQPSRIEDMNSTSLSLDQDPAELSDEADYREHEPGDQQRGLLTDIPLVLGPQEIEALPMIIQIGICPGLGNVLHGRDMQAMRCNILLAGESGRNLLRELLIFIAAWDLQDDEVYFKLMMQIMEAILENGLMPYAYQTFSEVKDIVSPAQSMIIKILTQLFRAKQHKLWGKPSSVADAKTTSNDDENSGRASATGNKTAAEKDKEDSTRRVDIYIVRYIFTIFRSSIIPETCALIYLQGQIKAGAALPEDFPLNLWDMERVYEGVYQFLEFFAVLTENEQWKKLLVQWEIVSELVTLLRELEISIPKAPITATSIPSTVAEAQARALQQNEAALAANTTSTTKSSRPTTPPQLPTPVSVERPFDLTPSGPAISPADDVTGDNVTQGTGAGAADVFSDHEGSDDSADPSDFEWRNLKKLVILVLSSLVWKSPTVQEQIRQYGGVEMVLACCNYDANNPYIREHAVMCLRFLLEGSGQNKAIVEKLQELGKLPPEELAKAGFKVDGLDSSGAKKKTTPIVASD